MKTLLSLISTISFIALHAQYFIPPMDNSEIGMAKTAYVVTNAGDTLRGTVGMATMINGQLRSFTFKKENGGKEKFKAEDLKLLAVQPHKLSNIASAMSVPSLQQAAKINFDEVINREWVYFEQALLPRKDKYALMQLLNPGFDAKIKVYQNPNANQSGTMSSGGINLIGGEDNSYLVVYDGNKSVIYKKSRYNKEALRSLYKDCNVFKENYDGERFRWNDFAEHVFVYDQLCKD